MVSPLMLMVQPLVSAAVAPLPASYPPQFYLTMVLVAPVVSVQEARFDKLKAVMDIHAALITALIVHKDKESSEATKRLYPLADEVYIEILPEKYKCPSFMKFYGDGNP